MLRVNFAPWLMLNNGVLLIIPAFLDIMRSLRSSLKTKSIYLASEQKLWPHFDPTKKVTELPLTTPHNHFPGINEVGG